MRPFRRSPVEGKRHPRHPRRKQSRGRVAALAHQVAALAGGWSIAEVRAVLASTEGADEAPDAAAQEKRWRAALKRANNARRHPADTTGPVPAGAEPPSA